MVQSPSRALLTSTHNATQQTSLVEQLKRDLDRAKFDIQHHELSRERELDRERQQRYEMEQELGEAHRRVERLERDRLWLTEQEKKMDEQRRLVEGEMKRLREEYEMEKETMMKRCQGAEERVGEMGRQLRISKVGQKAPTVTKQQDSSEVEKLQGQLMDKDQEIESLREQLQVKPTGDTSERVVALEREIKEVCLQNQQLERQGKRLREQLGQGEDMHAMAAKIERLESTAQRAAELEAQVEALQQERDQWVRVFGSATQSPYAAARSTAARDRRMHELQTQVESLQETKLELEAAHATIEGLRGERDQTRQQLDQANARLPQLEEARRQAERQLEFNGSEGENQRLQRELERVEREAARMEHQLGCGLGYDPRHTRILQLADNPSARDYAIRSETLGKLKEENEALVERLRKVEGTAEETEGESPLFRTIDNLKTEKGTLETKLAESAKLINRLKREWKRKASELCEVVNAVLGYKVEFLPSGAVRFTSAYASDTDQSFVFASGHDDHGSMRLSGGGSKAYLQGLSNDIRYWVQERGSIPGFMATITLQSYENYI